MLQLPPNSHRLGLSWSGQLIGNLPTATQFAAISPNEQFLTAVYIRACQTMPHFQANNKLNRWNHTLIPQSNNLQNYNFMQ